MEARAQLRPWPRGASFADRPEDRAGRNLRWLYLHPHVCLFRMAGTHRNALMVSTEIGTFTSHGLSRMDLDDR